MHAPVPLLPSNGLMICIRHYWNWWWHKFRTNFCHSTSFQIASLQFPIKILFMCACHLYFDSMQSNLCLRCHQFCYFRHFFLHFKSFEYKKNRKTKDDFIHPSRIIVIIIIRMQARIVRIPFPCIHIFGGVSLFQNIWFFFVLAHVSPCCSHVNLTFYSTFFFFYRLLFANIHTFHFPNITNTNFHYVFGFVFYFSVTVSIAPQKY